MFFMVVWMEQFWNYYVYYRTEQMSRYTDVVKTRIFTAGEGK